MSTMDNDKFGNKNHIITTGENCQASSSDEGNSAMVSDGDRSGNSSPPSGEISLGFDEGLHHEENPTKSAIQLQGEQSKRVPLDMLIPTEQLVNLAAISQPNDVVGRSDTKNCSASSVETHANNAIDSSTDQSSTPHPLTYDSLERQSQSFRLLRKLSDAADQAPYNNDAKNSREDTIPNASVMVPTTKNSPKVGSTRVKSGTSLRRGKWTVEEETYVARVIQDFNSGFLYAPAGTTLRTYLSEKLKCDPMRITKKFTGDACIGKRVFHPAVRCSSNAPSIDKAQAELETLERRWRRRLDMQIRESSKKASVAVAAASVSRSNLGSGSSENAQPNNPATTQTTAWLDRANSALSGPSLDDPEDISNLQLQIQQVQQLIDESTALKEANLELNCVLDEKSSVAPANEISPVHEVEPADKRMKTTEDAEALVGFLQQVRASAASGEQL